jgi:hypothetical protein
MWDVLYSLYCRNEERIISEVTLCPEEAEAHIYFPENACNRIALKEIEDFLGTKCKDYIRFLEFYNGPALGQWHFFAPYDPELSIVQIYNVEMELRKGTASDIENKMLPMAFISNAHAYYIAKMGAIFSLLSFSSIQNEADLEQEPLLVNRSFEEFINECVLGRRYPEFGKEDATYRYIQKHSKNEAELDEKYGSDEDENPTRDPRIMTSLREVGLDVAKQTYEQMKDLPEGTRINKVEIIKD